MRGETACGDDAGLAASGRGADPVAAVPLRYVFDAGEVFVEIPLPGKGTRACVTMPLEEWMSGGRTRGQRYCKHDIDGAVEGVNRAKNR